MSEHICLSRTTFSSRKRIFPGLFTVGTESQVSFVVKKRRNKRKQLKRREGDDLQLFQIKLLYLHETLDDRRIAAKRRVIDRNRRSAIISALAKHC
jgi:predicted transcriptional regulator